MVTGADSETERLTYQSPDMNLIPDAETLRIVPWYKDPTAQVICDCTDRHGEAIAFTPRGVLKRVRAHSTRRAAGGPSWRPNSNSSSRRKTSIPTIRC